MSKAHQRRDTACHGATVPAAPESQCCFRVVVIPQVLQVILEHVRDENRFIRRQEFPEPNAILMTRDMLFVSEEQPTSALDHTPAVASQHVFGTVRARYSVYLIYDEHGP